MSTLTETRGGPTTSPVEMSYRQAVNAALEDEMAADEAVILLGEDVASSGGVFKTNDGLAERFGAGRVRNTPICENTFVGAALGMAVTGMRPVVEIMFSDFLPTAADAIVNEVAKFRFMSGGQCSVPLTVRSIGGGTGRFGSQHSATGESFFLQAAGLKIATAGSPASAYATLRAAIRDQDPVLVFEHKALYGRRGPVVRGEKAIPPVGRANLVRSGSDATVVATLLMADRALAAAEQLAPEGIDLELIDPCWLRPMDLPAIEASVGRTGRLLIVEEQLHAGGWGAMVISHVAQSGIRLRAAPAALSLRDDVLIPYSPRLEDVVIPGVESIAAAARRLVGQALTAP